MLRLAGWNGCNELGSAGRRTGDFNGDGLAIFCGSTAPGVTGEQAAGRLLAMGGRRLPPQVSGLDPNLNGLRPVLLDINGDGKTDVLWNRIDFTGASLGHASCGSSKGDGTFIVHGQRQAGRTARWSAIAPISSTSMAMAFPTSCGLEEPAAMA